MVDQHHAQKITSTPSVPESASEWAKEALDERAWMEVEFARTYAVSFGHGTDGHHRLCLIAKLANLLDQHERSGYDRLIISYYGSARDAYAQAIVDLRPGVNRDDVCDMLRGYTEQSVHDRACDLLTLFSRHAVTRAQARLMLDAAIQTRKSIASAQSGYVSS